MARDQRTAPPSAILGCLVLMCLLLRARPWVSSIRPSPWPELSRGWCMSASRPPVTGVKLRLPDLRALRAACPDRRLRHAIDLLLAHDLREKFSTEQLSRRLGLSPRRVLHLFHEHFKFTPAQLIKARRLEQACHLFITSVKGVKEVMVEVGLNDFSHFVRDVKRAAGKTPSALRRELGYGDAVLENRKEGRR
jgi:AraC-like DNA-binding protein